MEKTENTGSTRSFLETANILYAVKFHRYSICLTGQFKITTWLILIRVIRVLEANPSNPQSGGLRPVFRVIVRMPECSKKKHVASLEAELATWRVTFSDAYKRHRAPECSQITLYC